MTADHVKKYECPYPHCPLGEEMSKRSGPKWWWYVAGPVTAAIIGFFAWQVAGAYSREVRIKALETNYATMKSDISEIKGDVKHLVWLKQQELEMDQTINGGTAPRHPK